MVRPSSSGLRTAGSAASLQSQPAYAFRGDVTTLAEAATVLDIWRQDYNDHRPHTTLGLLPPTAHKWAGIFDPRSVRVINRRVKLDEERGTRPTARLSA